MDAFNVNIFIQYHFINVLIRRHSNTSVWSIDRENVDFRFVVTPCGSLTEALRPRQQTKWLLHQGIGAYLTNSKTRNVMDHNDFTVVIGLRNCITVYQGFFIL